MNKKLISSLAAFALAASLAPATPLTALASQEAGKIHIVVENTTFTPESEGWDDAFWYGTLVDTWMPLSEDATAMSCIVAALDEKGYTQTGAEYSFIDSINGLKAYDGGAMSGWMGTINDWFANEGFDAFTVEKGTLSDGDEIRMLYSLSWGADIGSDWSSTDTSLQSIAFSEGSLDKAFDGAVYAYTLTVPAGVTGLYVTPTAANKNYQVRTRIGNTIYKRTAEVPVTDGAEIVVECNYEGAATMNAGGEPQTYTFTVQQAQAAEADAAGTLRDALGALGSAVPEPAFGNEWTVLALARGGLFAPDGTYFNGYYDRITATVNETAAAVAQNGALHKTKSTENSRLIIALAATGHPAQVGDWDLTAPYADFDWVKKQGLSGPVWALIALDTRDYATTDPTIRQQCIDYILANQVEAGGWTFSGKTADPDMTAMTLTALARYTEDAAVKAAVDKAVAALAAMQTESGGFASWGSESCESVAQVVTALSALGIDPAGDARFVKDGHSALDALLAYYNADARQFSHTLGGDPNAMANEQAVYALVAYDRFAMGRSPLYVMNDVGTEDDPAEQPATEPAETTAPATETTAPETTTVTTATETTAPATTATETTAAAPGTDAASTTTEGSGELPQTGSNDPLSLLVCVAAMACMLTGGYAVTRAGRRSEED